MIGFIIVQIAVLCCLCFGITGSENALVFSEFAYWTLFGLNVAIMPLLVIALFAVILSEDEKVKAPWRKKVKLSTRLSGVLSIAVIVILVINGYLWLPICLTSTFIIGSMFSIIIRTIAKDDE